MYNLTSEKPIDREKGRELKEKNDENREREVTNTRTDNKSRGTINFACEAADTSQS